MTDKFKPNRQDEDGLLRDEQIIRQFFNDGAGGTRARQALDRIMECATRDAAEVSDEFGYFELGRSFYEEFARLSNDENFKDFICGCSPVEILVHLINERDEWKSRCVQLDDLRREMQADNEGLQAVVAAPPQPAPDAVRLCSCKASQRDGQHMAWCPVVATHDAMRDAKDGDRFADVVLAACRASSQPPQSSSEGNNE